MATRKFLIVTNKNVVGKQHYGLYLKNGRVQWMTPRYSAVVGVTAAISSLANENPMAQTEMAEDAGLVEVWLGSEYVTVARLTIAAGEKSPYA